MNSLWPYDNNINISDLSRAEQHERELFIQNAMEIFSRLPFQIGDSQLYRPNVSIKPLNLDERHIFERELYALSDYIERFYYNKKAILDHVPGGLYIPVERLVYDTIQTHIEYWPVTNAGKYNTQPLRVHYSTVRDASNMNPIESTGELKWGIDGNVCAATVRIFANRTCFSYSFGVIGRTFAITKLETPSSDGKQAVLYSSAWDYMDW